MDISSYLEEAPCGEMQPEEAERTKYRDKNFLGTCSKCNIEKSRFLYRECPICWKCFQNVFRKKLKQGLNYGRRTKSKSEKALVAFSGGPSSSSLLHALHHIIIDKNEKFLFDITVVYIDESAVLNLCETERQDTNKEIERVLISYSFPFLLIPLEKVFSTESVGFSFHSLNQLASNDIKNNIMEFVDKERDQLRSVFHNTKSNCSKEDLLIFLRNHLLAQIARSMRIDTVIFGSCATRLSNILISYTCKGRGYSVGQELEPLNCSKYDGLRLLRPMRDFLSKEIAFYNHFNQVDVIAIPTFSTMTNNSGFSIEFLTEKFIESLQREGFSQTAHSLLRSGSKLITGSAIKNDRPSISCALCFSPLSDSELENDLKEYKPISPSKSPNEVCCYKQRSTSKEENWNNDELSSKDSTMENQCNQEKCCEFQRLSKQQQQSLSDIKRWLCYGCQRTISESEVAYLPPFVAKNVLRAQNTYRMKEEIKEFLCLEEDQ